MAKKGPIGRAEGFYIEHHISTKTIAELSEELDRTVSSIETFVKKNNIKPSNRLTVGDQLARSKGSVVMTENASSLSDITKQKIVKHSETCISKIK